MARTNFEELLDAGVHFGHLKRKWNPNMAPYIFMERNGIHIIDLYKTVAKLEEAASAAKQIVKSGKRILFVATKKQAKEIVSQHVSKVNMPYVTERSPGGMLTNFATIRKSIKRLNAIDKMEVDGTFEKITKKGRLLLTREKDRLRKVFGGIEDMTRLPGALFIVDIKKEHIAVKEAKILGIPVIALVDTNVDPEEVDIPIPANDDSAKTVELIAGLFAKTIEEGAAIAKTHAADKRKEAPADAGDVQGDAAVVKRKLRKRKTRKPAEQKEETKEVKEEATTETKEEPKPEVKEQAETEKADNTEEKEN